MMLEEMKWNEGGETLTAILGLGIDFESKFVNSIMINDMGNLETCGPFH